ncbi:MAG: hypothetical protein ACREIC_06885 [Limisphaerales bacterium]
MKTLIATAALLAYALAGSAAEPEPSIPVPTPQQVAWHEAGVGLFFHWAPNVYQGTEGDNRSTPLREDIVGGERVRKFVVEGRRADGTWIALVRGTQVGSRQIIPIPPTAVQSVRFIVQESVAPVRIREFSVFHVNRPVPKLAYRQGAGASD